MIREQFAVWKIFYDQTGDAHYALVDCLKPLRICVWWNNRRRENGWVLQERTDDGWRNRHFVAASESEDAVRQLKNHAEILYAGRLSAPGERPLC
jgi:hypothetical protein